MKLVIHDYAGHPFQVYLSRHLARRGHEVIHLYDADNPGPKGCFDKLADDPPSLRFHGVSLGRQVDHAKGTGAQLFTRRFIDVAYGRKTARLICDLKPDIVLSGNTPTEAQDKIIRACKAAGIRFVYWVQDVYSVAVTKLLSRRLGIAGKTIGWYYQRLDQKHFRASDAIVVISEGFLPVVTPWADGTPVSVIENWAAIDDLPRGEKDNSWSREFGLNQDFTFLYSGTLGRKHNPDLLWKLAQAYGAEAQVVVVGQGHGIPQLQKAKAEHRLDGLRLLPIQPAQQLANVLATSDVLLATIEPDAGTFAVPSKVLSYLCAGRPIVLAAPKENLAARIVTEVQAGIVVEPDDAAGFLAGCDQLRREPSLRAGLGANGRAYAERTFDIQRITDRFEEVLVR